MQNERPPYGVWVMPALIGAGGGCARILSHYFMGIRIKTFYSKYTRYAELCVAPEGLGTDYTLLA